MYKASPAAPKPGRAEELLSSSDPTASLPSRVRVLLVGDDGAGARAIRDLLDASTSMAFDLVHAPRLANALPLSKADEADVMLLSISADELPRLTSLTQARMAAPLVPIVVISDVDDEAVALKALQNGARGYLVRSEASTRLLVTTLGAALESHRMILQLNTARERARHLATHDQLTGLANRSLFHDRLSQAVSAARFASGDS